MEPPDPADLTPTMAVDYLQDRGIVPQGVDADATPLGGGVSNHVLRITWDEDCLVVKQPLPNLAVEDDWPADIDRIHNEAAAARTYASVIAAEELPARVPEVYLEDEAAHLLAIECAPAGTGSWKTSLLSGEIDSGVADTVGRVLGAVHTAAADDPTVEERFASKRPFDQLRIDPYHRTTADRHPDVAESIMAEVERIMSVDRTLVHGDYSPKNVLLGETPWIIDFEVAHWGDPAFDVAFMANHLFIKSVYNAAHQEAYLDAADRFWQAYRELVPWSIEADCIVELGILMLARVDGKSPVEYVEEGPVADALRRIAKRSIREDLTTFERFTAVTREETPI